MLKMDFDFPQKTLSHLDFDNSICDFWTLRDTNDLRCMRRLYRLTRKKISIHILKTNKTTINLWKSFVCFLHHFISSDQDETSFA